MNDMFSIVLYSRSGQAQELVIEVNLTPPQPPNLILPLAREQQQVDDIKKVAVLVTDEGSSYFRDLILG